MKIYLLSSLICIYSLSENASNSQTYREQTILGIEYAYNMKIDSATAIFRNIIALDRENPHGYLLQAVNYFYQIEWGEDKALEEKFRKLNSQAIIKAKHNLTHKRHRRDALFYLGTAYMYLAAYHGGKDNWWRAYKFGRAGIKYLEELADADPQYFDAYLGLGLYHYYAAVMPKMIKTISSLLGIKGDRLAGLRELHLAAERGTYSKTEALFFLGNIYLEMEKNSEKALWCAQRLVGLYPANPGFQIFLAECYRFLGDTDSALIVLQQSLAMPASQRYRFFRVLSHIETGHVYFDRENFAEAIYNYRQAENLAMRMDNLKWAIKVTREKIARCFELSRDLQN